MRKRSIFNKTDELTYSYHALPAKGMQCKSTKNFEPTKKNREKQGEVSYDENYRVSFKFATHR